MKTIKDVCSMYGVKPLERGYIVTAGGMITESIDTSHRFMVWTPTSKNSSWNNVLSENETIISECPLNDADRFSNLESAQEEKDVLRITFWRENSSQEFRFIGVFKIDLEVTTTAGVRIYRRVSDLLPAIPYKNKL